MTIDANIFIEFLGMLKLMTSKYKLIVGERIQVERDVNRLLEEGWELHGSPSMSHGANQNSPRISQALIKLIE